MPENRLFIVILSLILSTETLADNGDLDVNSVLDIRISAFEVTEQPLFQCLWLLSQELTDDGADSSPIIVLETTDIWVNEWVLPAHAEQPVSSEIPGVAPRPEPELVTRAAPWFPPITVELQEGTVRQVLDAFMEQDGTHTWLYDPECDVVNVLPEKWKGSCAWFLNRPVVNVHFYAGEGMEAIDRIATENKIPFEMSRFMRTVGERRFVEDKSLDAFNFRTVVNSALSNIGSNSFHFYLIKTLPSPGRPQEFGSSQLNKCRAKLWDPRPGGFSDSLEFYGQYRR